MSTERLLPDLDDQLVDALARVEEMLLTIAAWEEDPDDGAGPFVVPAPLGGRVALDALNRVQDAVAPTQTRTDRAGQEIPPTALTSGRMLGPDGRYEHLPLRLVLVDRHDLDVLAAAAAELGRALATPARTDQHTELVEALHAGAEAAAPTFGPTPAPVELVEALARAHGLLDLADTDDAAMVRRRLVDAAGADVVLTAADEAAYQRLAERMNTMWTSRDPLARWLY